MKKSVRLTAVTLALGLFFSLPGANAETALKLNRFDAPDSFVAAHPDVVITVDTHYYKNTGEMTSEMLLGTFDSDVFRLDSIGIDYQSIMEKGYCLDLSGSEIIQNAIQNLYPVYADQCLKNGKIYAVPTGGQLNYYLIDTDTLAEAGMGGVEIPDTFPEFLDFVEAWNARLEDDPGDIALCAMVFWDESDFNRVGGYTYYLVDFLLENHILQKSFAGEPLRFNEPEVVELLKRCYQLGHELDLNDPAYNANKSILGQGAGGFMARDGSAFLCLRLNEYQPKLIEVYLDLVAVNARTDNPELCIEMLEDVVEDNDLTDELLQQKRTFLYQNIGLVPSKRHDEAIATSQRHLDRVKSALANENLSAADRYELEEELKWREEDLQEAIASEDDKWVVTQEQLDIYRSYTDYLYVPMPGVFNANGAEQAKVFEQSKARFVAGQMTAEELVNELDRVAEMIERESE